MVLWNGYKVTSHVHGRNDLLLLLNPRSDTLIFLQYLITIKSGTDKPFPLSFLTNFLWKSSDVCCQPLFIKENRCFHCRRNEKSMYELDFSFLNIKILNRKLTTTLCTKLLLIFGDALQLGDKRSTMCLFEIIYSYIL